MAVHQEFDGIRLSSLKLYKGHHPQRFNPVTSSLRCPFAVKSYHGVNSVSEMILITLNIIAFSFFLSYFAPCENIMACLISHQFFYKRNILL